MSPNADRFERLMAPHHALVRNYIVRLIGHPSDAEDVLQDVLIKGLEKLSSLRREEAFRGWIMRIATTTALDALRKEARWRPHAQAYVEDECRDSESLRTEVVETTRDSEFFYDAREHLSFCFTCVARSLPPEQEAAIVLREVLGFTNREAAKTLSVTESVLRHHLADGRKAMEKSFDGLCALVNKEGICRQCAGFRAATTPERRGPPLPVLNTPETRWADRLEVVRETTFDGGVATTLHDLLFSRIRRIERAAADTKNNT